MTVVWMGSDAGRTLWEGGNGKTCRRGLRQNVSAVHIVLAPFWVASACGVGCSRLTGILSRVASSIYNIYLINKLSFTTNCPPRSRAPPPPPPRRLPPTSNNIGSS